MGMIQMRCKKGGQWLPFSVELHRDSGAGVITKQHSIHALHGFFHCAVPAADEDEFRGILEGVTPCHHRGGHSVAKRPFIFQVDRFLIFGMSQSGFVLDGRPAFSFSLTDATGGKKES